MTCTALTEMHFLLLGGGSPVQLPSLCLCVTIHLPEGDVFHRVLHGRENSENDLRQGKVRGPQTYVPAGMVNGNVNPEKKKIRGKKMTGVPPEQDRHVDQSF